MASEDGNISNANIQEKLIHGTLRKFVHFDLKGAPLKPMFLKNIYPLLRKWGVNGILLEWEDCFPYGGDLADLNNGTYSIEDTLQILEDIKRAKLEVIPLVQTFGHMEFLLKHRSFMDYREVPLYPSSLCPSHPNSVQIVCALLEQVIRLHSGIQRFHIGADEVWHLGLCDRCKARISAGESKEDLFLKHVRAILEFIRSKWPDLKLIMWDDMLREMDEPIINAYNLKSLVEPMVWHYCPAETFRLPPDLWRKYAVFPNIWIAGSFKGSSGGSQLMPPPGHHTSNVLEWIRNMEQIKTTCQGFVLTGWSRYDHFAALCETLPCGLPTLGVCLKVLSDGNYTPETVALIEKEMKLPDLESLAKSTEEEDQTLFASWQVLIHTSQVMNLRQSSQAVLSCDQLQTWMSEYQVIQDRVNPMQIVSLIPVLRRMVEDFTSLDKKCRHFMQPIFYDGTINEWVQTYISTPRARVESVLLTAEAVVDKATKAVDEATRTNSMDF